MLYAPILHLTSNLNREKPICDWKEFRIDRISFSHTLLNYDRSQLLIPDTFYFVSLSFYSSFHYLLGYCISLTPFYSFLNYTIYLLLPALLTLSRFYRTRLRVSHLYLYLILLCYLFLSLQLHSIYNRFVYYCNTVVSIAPNWDLQYTPAQI